MKRLHVFSTDAKMEIVVKEYLFTGNANMSRQMNRVGKLRNLLATKDTSR